MTLSSLRPNLDGASYKSHYGIDIIGPVQKDHSWQAKSGEAFDVTHFTINWEEKFVVCPQGHVSTKWHPDQDARSKDVIKARFLGKTCRACPVRARCTRSKAQPRELTFRPQESFVALNQRRQIQETKEFQKEYKARAGIESSHSQATRRSGLRRTRYIGLVKTHLQHVLTAIAINFVRLDAWFNNIPIAKTRISRFKRELQPTAT